MGFCLSYNTVPNIQCLLMSFSILIEPRYYDTLVAVFCRSYNLRTAFHSKYDKNDLCYCCK